MNIFTKNQLLSRGLGLTAALLIGVAPALQDEKAQDEKSRDPFRRPEASKPAQEEQDEKVVFTEAETPLALPLIRLRGYVEPAAPTETPAAMIEVEGHGSFIVRKDDSLSLQGTGSNNLSLLVRRVSRQQVEVVAGTVGQVIIVR